MALCTSAAATAESTPPAQCAQDPLRPDLGPHGLHLLLDDRDVGPRRPAAAHVEQEALEHLAAPLGVDDLGMELHAEDAALGVMHGGNRGVGAGGGGGEARRGAVMASPWLIHTCDETGRSCAERGRAGQRRSSVRPYSPRPVRDTVPPSCRAMSWAP